MKVKCTRCNAVFERREEMCPECYTFVEPLKKSPNPYKSKISSKKTKVLPKQENKSTFVSGDELSDKFIDRINGPELLDRGLNATAIFQNIDESVEKVHHDNDAERQALEKKELTSKSQQEKQSQKALESIEIEKIKLENRKKVELEELAQKQEENKKRIAIKEELKKVEEKKNQKLLEKQQLENKIVNESKIQNTESKDSDTNDFDHENFMMINGRKVRIEGVETQTEPQEKENIPESAIKKDNKENSKRYTPPGANISTENKKTYTNATDLINNVSQSKASSTKLNEHRAKELKASTKTSKGTIIGILFVLILILGISFAIYKFLNNKKTITLPNSINSTNLIDDDVINVDADDNLLSSSKDKKELKAPADTNDYSDIMSNLVEKKEKPEKLKRVKTKSKKLNPSNHSDRTPKKIIEVIKKSENKLQRFYHRKLKEGILAEGAIQISFYINSNGNPFSLEFGEKTNTSFSDDFLMDMGKIIQKWKFSKISNKYMDQKINCPIFKFKKRD